MCDSLEAAWDRARVVTHLLLDPMANTNTLHIVDGSGYIFRAYYAIRPLSTAEGEPTNAVYGFTTMIEKLLREETPEYLAITFDRGGPNFRKEIFEDYKATRPPPPDDLSSQVPRIHQIVEAFQIPSFTEEGVEADDVIATLTKQALADGWDVRIITGDKDLMQLVNERVTLWEPMRNKRYDAEAVEDKMGVTPDQVADALALAGDSSDNVPGVRGVGPKTAAKLLSAHGDSGRRALRSRRRKSKRQDGGEFGVVGGRRSTI